MDDFNDFFRALAMAFPLKPDVDVHLQDIVCSHGPRVPITRVRGFLRPKESKHYRRAREYDAIALVRGLRDEENHDLFRLPPEDDHLKVLEILEAGLVDGAPIDDGVMQALRRVRERNLERLREAIVRGDLEDLTKPSGERDL